MVGSEDDARVMLYDYDRMPAADELVERAEQDLDIGMRQARGGLIEDEDSRHCVLLREERGEFHALALAAR